MYIKNILDTLDTAGYIEGYEPNYMNIVELVNAYGDSPFLLADRATKLGYYIGLQAAKKESEVN